MNNCREMEALQEYIKSLEKELQTKSIEQETLYRALEASEKELSSLDQLYFFKTVLTHEVASLKNQLELANQEKLQMNEVVRELEWARGQIAKLSKILNAKDFQESQFQEVDQENQQLKVRIESLENQFSQERNQNEILRCQLRQHETRIEAKKQEICALQDKLEALSQNYIKVEQAFFEKDHIIQDLREENQEINECINNLKQQMGQKNIMISCLESQLQEARLTYRSEPQSELENRLEDIDKTDLIKQANSLIERVHAMEWENRGYRVQQTQKNIKMHAYLQDLKQEFESLSTRLQL